jgi:hypothetical protein
MSLRQKDKDYITEELNGYNRTRAKRAQKDQHCAGEHDTGKRERGITSKENRTGRAQTECRRQKDRYRDGGFNPFTFQTRD